MLTNCAPIRPRTSFQTTVADALIMPSLPGSAKSRAKAFAAGMVSFVEKAIPPWLISTMTAPSWLPQVKILRISSLRWYLHQRAISVCHISPLPVRRPQANCWLDQALQVATPLVIHLSGTISSGCSGDLKLQWSESSSNSNAITVMPGSYIRAEKIE